MLLEKLKSLSLVDLLALVTPFIIIMGLINKIGIYSHNDVNAIWFISMFTPVDFMISDLMIYSYFALALIYLEKIILDKSENQEKMLLKSNVMLFSAFMGMSIFKFFSGESISPIILFYSYCFLSLNGFGILIISKSMTKLGGLALILLVPFISGYNHANKISNKGLPIVELNKGENWYLLDKHSDKLILINSSTRKNEFKVVEMNEVNLLK